MTERAKATVYWPGITSDIRRVRQSCNSCNRNMPSQAKTPPAEPRIPTSPFEAIAADYFDYMGSHYFVSADRLSGWVEMQKIKVGTNEAGATGLCTALRRMMVTFGVPEEISSSVSTIEGSTYSPDTDQDTVVDADLYVNVAS